VRNVKCATAVFRNPYAMRRRLAGTICLRQWESRSLPREAGTPARLCVPKCRSMNDCAQCRKLRDRYEDATIKYMRFHDGKPKDAEEGHQLLEQMNAANKALTAHQQSHASKN
jgi:hypothetical protein